MISHDFKSMELKFIIDSKNIKRCFSFAKEILTKEAQSSRDFGSIRRDIVDATADTVEGKLAELVFRRFLRRSFDVDIEVDFEIYPSQRAVDFGQDAEKVKRAGQTMLNPCRIDVKATRAYSKWLLIEGHKFWADAYVSVALDLPRDFEKDPDCVERAESVVAEVRGFAYYFDIIDPNTKEPWFLFKQGDTLFDPGELPPKVLENTEVRPALLRSEVTRRVRNGKLRLMGRPLKAERNYGLPLDWLRNSESEWRYLSNMCTGSLLQSDDQVVLTHMGTGLKRRGN
ncbi:hypothetical protein ACFLTY_00240 [Chloroflexota bacterium]